MRSFRALSSDARWSAALAAATALVLLVNPLGFIGGGWDDWQYLNAARCWREHGPCLPQDHWQGRWPVVAPLAAITQLFGESRLTVSLWPLAASLCCLGLLAHAGNRLFGRPVGWIAALLLLAAPAFSIQLLAPSVEAVELALLLAGFALTLAWGDRRSWPLALLAGLCFGLALQVRETALVATGFTAVYVLVRRPSPDLPAIVAALAGFFLPLAIEFAVFWLSTGDPLWRRRLSVAHTLIPSSELRGPLDPSRPPFFNPAYIANWKHEPGIQVHWLVDGLLNLFANAKAGLALALVPVLLLVGRRRLGRPAIRSALVLWLVAIAYAAVLIFALAMDPKARIMFVPITLASLALALLSWRLLDSGGGVFAFTAWAVAAAAGLSVLFVHQATHVLERPAARWIAAHRGEVEIDPNTRRHLALVPAAEALPGLESDSRYLIYNSVRRCSGWIERSGLPRGSLTVVDEVPISNMGRIVHKLTGALCLLRYEQPLSAEQVRAAIRRSRVDGRFILIPRQSRRPS